MNQARVRRLVAAGIRYAKTRSPWLDLKIILRTVPALLEQIQAIRQGRKSMAASAYTIPPFG